MLQDERVSAERALRRARVSAYAPAQYVEQESFMLAGEILELGRRAGIAPGVRVLDLCCGVAGPGRFLTRELGCAYLGVDASADAIAIARERAGKLPCRFEVRGVPPLPGESYDVMLLLETMLAFCDKAPLVKAIGSALPAGGRFAFTLEEGAPLSSSERDLMPDADTVWPVPLEEMLGLLSRAGLVVTFREDRTPAHRAVASALVEAFVRERTSIAARIGTRAVDELIAGHRLWSEWLACGRVRKFALVAEKASGWSAHA